MAYGPIYVHLFLSQNEKCKNQTYIPSGTLGGKLTVFNLDWIGKSGIVGSSSLGSSNGTATSWVLSGSKLVKAKIRPPATA